MCMAAMQQAWYALYYEAGDALEGYGEYGDMTPDEVCEALSGMFDEHKSLCLTMFKAILSGRRRGDAGAGGHVRPQRRPRPNCPTWVTG